MNELLLVMKMAIQLGALAEQIAAIIKRVEAGEKITPEELEASYRQVNEAVAKWEAATNKPAADENKISSGDTQVLPAENDN